MATTSKKPARKPVSKKTKTTRKVSASTSKKTTAKKVVNKKSTKVTSVKTKASSAATDTAVITAKVKKESTRSTTSTTTQSLRKLNLFAAFVSAVQAALILFVSKAFGGIHSITTTYPTNDSLAGAKGAPAIVTASRRLFDVHYSWLLAALFVVAAVLHLSYATWLRRRYEREIDLKANRPRWIAGSVMSSIILVVIAMLAGVTDISTLLAIIGFTVGVHLVALSLEHYAQNGSKTRLGYAVGAGAAVLPALIIAIYTLGTHQYGSVGVPMFVYWIYLTVIVIYALFANTLKRSLKADGRRADYMYVERMFIWLSLIANAAVAWQVYAGALKK